MTSAFLSQAPNSSASAGVWNGQQCIAQVGQPVNTVDRKARQQLAERETASLVDPKATGIMAMLEKELAGDRMQRRPPCPHQIHGFWLSCHHPGTRIHVSQGGEKGKKP